MPAEAPVGDNPDLKELLTVLTVNGKGNFSPRIPSAWTGLSGKIADMLTVVSEMNDRMMTELDHLRRVVWREGELTRCVLTKNVNRLAADLTALNPLLYRARNTVLTADCGRDALSVRESEEGIDAILMNIMMPITDSHETVQAMRAMDRDHTLSLIAVTARVHRKRPGKAPAGRSVRLSPQTHQLSSASRQ